MALVISKQIELKPNWSIKKFIYECKKITEARLKNQLTGKEIHMRAKPTSPITELFTVFDLLT